MEHLTLAVQKRRQLARKHLPLSLATANIKLLDELEQHLIQAYEAGISQIEGQAWSNQSAMGYAIMAADQIGWSDEQIHQLVKALHNRFDAVSLEQAAEHYRKSPY